MQEISLFHIFSRLVKITLNGIGYAKIVVASEDLFSQLHFFPYIHYLLSKVNGRIDLGIDVLSEELLGCVVCFLLSFVVVVVVEK